MNNRRDGKWEEAPTRRNNNKNNNDNDNFRNTINTIIEHYISANIKINFNQKQIATHNIKLCKNNIKNITKKKQHNILYICTYKMNGSNEAICIDVWFL